MAPPSDRSSQRKPDNPPTVAVIEANKRICAQGVRYRMKDPEDARVTDIRRSGSFRHLVGGSPQVPVFYSLTVNGKNSYRGYSGERYATCIFTKDEAAFVEAIDL